LKNQHLLQLSTCESRFPCGLNSPVRVVRCSCDVVLTGVFFWLGFPGPRAGANKGLAMKKTFATALVAAVFSTGAGYAADLPVKAKAAPAPAPAASPWDIAFGAWVASDYNFRGVTQSAHQPAVGTYIEPRYNFTDTLQGYIGIGGESIDFPNHA